MSLGSASETAGVAYLAGVAGSQTRFRVQISPASQAGLHCGSQTPTLHAKPGEQIGLQASAPAAPNAGIGAAAAGAGTGAAAAGWRGIRRANVALSAVPLSMASEKA
jgi:hypothetical protein